MSGTMDIYIGRDWIKAAWFRPRGGYRFRDIPSALDGFTKALEEIMAEDDVPRDIVIYLAEDILFFSKFELDRQTPDLRRAIAMQLEMVSPYGEESLYAYEAQRQKEGYAISLYAAERFFVEPFLRQIHTLDLRLVGMYPEGQRYLTRETQKLEWGLWVAGRFGKLLHFKEGRLQERLQCPLQMAAEQLTSRSGLATIYALGEVAGFVSSDDLLEQPAKGQRFDLLPKSYRRPDYLKGVIIGLLVINLLLALVWGGAMLVGVDRQASRLAAEVSALKPQVKQVAELHRQEQELEATIASFKDMAGNNDFITFLADLTTALPLTTYLDQIRLDNKKKTIHLQGYTDDLSQLTSALQKLGNSTLKSTRKRRNQTYFHVEVSLS